MNSMNDRHQMNTLLSKYLGQTHQNCPHSQNLEPNKPQNQQSENSFLRLSDHQFEEMLDKYVDYPNSDNNDGCFSLKNQNFESLSERPQSRERSHLRKMHSLEDEQEVLSQEILEDKQSRRNLLLDKYRVKSRKKQWSQPKKQPRTPKSLKYAEHKNINPISYKLERGQQKTSFLIEELKAVQEDPKNKKTDEILATNGIKSSKTLGQGTTREAIRIILKYLQNNQLPSCYIDSFMSYLE